MPQVIIAGGNRLYQQPLLAEEASLHALYERAGLHRAAEYGAFKQLQLGVRGIRLSAQQRQVILDLLAVGAQLGELAV